MLETHLKTKLHCKKKSWQTCQGSVFFKALLHRSFPVLTPCELEKLSSRYQVILQVFKALFNALFRP